MKRINKREPEFAPDGVGYIETNQAVEKRATAAGADVSDPNERAILSHSCPCCGARMIIMETFNRGSTARQRGEDFPGDE